jgi:exodeoxyribonuclease V beta subunit
MYVALTRARHQAVIWWIGSWGSRDSPLGRLLFARDEHGNVKPEGSSRPSDEVATARFQELAGAAGGAIEVERSVLGVPASWGGAPLELRELAASVFERRLDARWRRTSYSDITAAAHELVVGSEPELDVLADEPFGTEDAVASDELPLGAMPAGARVGTFIHHVLEATDFAAADLTAELGERIAAEQARGRVEIGDPEQVASGLAAAIETPFHPGSVALRSLHREDRLDELTFELPLAGGDEPTGELTVAAIARALRDGLDSDDPLAGYAERLADPTLRRDVRGYLTGSIDLVLRLRSGDGAPDRYAIVDYKTNWLGGPDEQLSTHHYRPAALLAEMTGAHYGLQALLYAAALHRYLRWRVPGYDAGRDLAGVHYLFLRGMTGPPGQGVFSWRPPGSLVAALSDVLDGVSAQ